MSVAPRSEDARPSPLTPPDADLQDFPFMPLHVARLRDSDLAAEGDPEACWYAVLLWAASWHQLPAGSLPANDAVLTRLIGLGRDVATFARHKDHALRGFIECADGRLYHPVVAEQVNAAWDSKQAFQQRKASRTEIARKAADARWSRDADAGGMPEASTSDASGMRNASEIDASRIADAMPKGTGTGTGTTEEEADASPSAAQGERGKRSEADNLWREITAAYAEHVIRGRGSPMLAKSAWLKLSAEDRRLVLTAIRPFANAAPWGSHGPPALARFIGDEIWREFVTTATVTDIVWRGPPAIREAVAAEMGEAFTRSNLDPAEWRVGGGSPDVPPAVIPRNIIAAQKLRPVAALKGVAIHDPIQPRKTA